MLRSAGAVVGGYAAMAVGTILMFAVIMKARGVKMEEAMGEVPTTAFSLSILVAGMFWAMLGGWLCARIATDPSWTEVFVLAGLVVLLGAASTMSEQYQHTQIWYRIGLPVVGCVGVLLGGRLEILKAL